MRRALLSAVLALVAGAAGVLVAPAATAQADLDYVALGDSYASGTGTRNYDPASGDCLRSPVAYPQLWVNSHATSSFTFAACSGATTDDVLAGQLGGLNAGTDLVTISIGGNDAGFVDVLTACHFNFCDGQIDDAQAYIRDQLPARLDVTYGAIRGAAPNADVVVLGYPQLFQADRSCAPFLSEGNKTRLNQTADLLSDVTAGRAGAAGFAYADTRDEFAGHGVCSGSEWVNGLSNPIVESYHPNPAGHSAGYLPVLVGITG